MSDNHETLLAGIRAGDQRLAARVITRIESGDTSLYPLLGKLYASAPRTPVIGITGPPGAGKSTLLDQLLTNYRARGMRVAVLAIDPSSPFSGGAILGDRVRMGRHNADPGVFIRSMASRGHLGGMAVAAREALIVLDALGFDRIFVETVGVGQSEVDVMHHAQSVLLVLTPLSGDSLQAVKAGVLEIADMFAVNKADSPGVERMLAALRESVGFRHEHSLSDWAPPILTTQADQGHGVAHVVEAIEAHHAHWLKHPELSARRLREQARQLLLDFVSTQARLHLERPGVLHDRFEYLVDKILLHRCDLHSAAARLLGDWEQADAND